jgi:alcohol dehydrogenase (cytochrome c)
VAWHQPNHIHHLFATIDRKGLVTVDQDVVLKDVKETYQIYPSYGGGRDWPMGAYNPKSEIMLMPLSNACCLNSTARTDREAAPEFVYNTTNVGRFPPGKGGLVFNGAMDRYVRALDADDGQLLWETRVPSQAVGGPIIYSVNGRQYVAIAAGGGAVAALQWGLTPEADTVSRNNGI